MKRYFLLIPFLCSAVLQAAEYRTDNFTVTCADAALAKQIGDTAEFYRKEHAKDWLGKELPKWYSPCPVNVQYGQTSAGGATTFSFVGGEVTGWNMDVFGPKQRLLDSVVPHEVLHTIFACRYRRPVPRWADEGAATYTESAAEQKQYRDAGLQVVGTQEHIPLSHLLSAMEYPKDGRKVFVFYGQAFVLAEYLLDLKGRPEYIAFLDTYFKTGSWETAFAKHYGQNPGEAYTVAITAKKPPATPVDYNTYHIDIFVQSSCGPCHTFKEKELPKLLKAKNLKLRIYDLDKDYTWERAKQDGITGTPAFIVYKNEKRQAVLQGPHTAEQLLAECKGAKTVKAAQGIGIGYFGPLPGSNNQAGSRANPHQDFSAAQLQQLNQIVDQRAQVAINDTITVRIDDLKRFVDAQIKTFALEVQEKLTDEQKQMIGATDEQKAIIAGFKDQIAAVEADKAKFIEEHKETLSKVQKQNEALAAEVEAAKDTAVAAQSESLTLKERVKELAKGTLSAGLATALQWASISLPVGGVAGYALKLFAGILAARRKETDPASK